MVLNFLSGGAAINVLARLNHVEVNVVDVGIDADLFGYAGLTDCKVRRGSRNMLQEPAMSEEEVAAALRPAFRWRRSPTPKETTWSRWVKWESATAPPPAS